MILALKGFLLLISSNSKSSEDKTDFLGLFVAKKLGPLGYVSPNNLPSAFVTGFSLLTVISFSLWKYF